MPKYFDIHSHVSFSKFEEDREEVIDRMKEGGVHTITVGVDKKSSEEAVLCAEKYDNVYACIGLHPVDNKKESFDEKDYEKLVTHPKVVAIGECGLDYLRISADDEQEKKRQRDEFEKQIAFAVKYDKPLMIHCREAHEDALEVLSALKKEYGDKMRGNIHFFSEGIETAKRYFDLDFTVSVTGVITFTEDYNEVISQAPLSMLMSETDCPYVAPVPFRGKRNEPLYVKEVVEHIAKIRGEDVEKVRRTLVENAYRVFGGFLK